MLGTPRRVGRSSSCELFPVEAVHHLSPSPFHSVKKIRKQHSIKNKVTLIFMVALLLLVEETWANYLNSLCLSFLICEDILCRTFESIMLDKTYKVLY